MKQINNNEPQNKTEVGKMTDRKMYTINGSEDGAIGIYGNATLAIENAINYVSSYGRKLADSRGKYYKQLCQNGAVIIEAGPMEDTVSATIDMFYLNQRIDKS